MTERSVPGIGLGDDSLAEATSFGSAPLPRNLAENLNTAAIAAAGLADVESAGSEREKAHALARLALDMFEDYFALSRRIPWLAKQAFERRDWQRALGLSHDRIKIFSDSIERGAPVLDLALRSHDRIGGFWNTVEERFRRLLGNRYEAELALAYLATIRRRVYEDSWTPVDYHRIRQPRPGRPDFLRRIEIGGAVTAADVDRILDLPNLDVAWRNRPAEAKRTADRINEVLGTAQAPIAWIDMVDQGFYRNRGAYLVGQIGQTGDNGASDGIVTHPFALALLHAEGGVYIDAVLTRETTLRHVFSSTLANFHVPVTAYHELVDFLHGLMPTRPHGLHYSTIGYNHVGKLAVMEQIGDSLDTAGQPLDFAPGPRGSVAIGFTAPGLGYVLKVIRDTPTASYKWESYDGVASVLAKYSAVHEINRSGSMLDNIIYSNLSLPRDLFGEALLEELLGAADSTVTLHRGDVFFRHLIAQRKLTPVPLYLDACTPEEAEAVVIRLGQCIRNNAASNVFNRDLDGRNYGVNSLRFVHLFDYDAVERLTEVKVRTNADREAGEEDIPDWFFEEGPIFLPEELEAHLRLPTRDLRRLFREAHGELLTAEYWTRMQRLLREGGVPRVRTYPRATQLNPPQPPRRLVAG
ncbi:MAG: isocitrate dehydrogenase kinase/phosphatase AceK regulatory subunit [Pseudomonadota bacterium]